MGWTFIDFFKNRKCNIDVTGERLGAYDEWLLPSNYKIWDRWRDDAKACTVRKLVFAWSCVKYITNQVLSKSYLTASPVYRFTICCIHARHARVPASSHLSLRSCLRGCEFFRDKHALNFIITFHAFFFLNIYRNSKSNSSNIFIYPHNCRNKNI